jgi:uncharacterized protein YllA (UPF0747 family)
VLRPFSSEIIATELEEGGEETNRLIAESADALRAAGFAPPLEPRERAVNVYLYENGLRSRLTADGRDRIVSKVSGKSYTRAELAALARAEPRRFSTGVALRPVVQDKALPTAVFVGGPSEIAYFAQLQGVHERFGAPFPLVWPRVSATLVDAGIQEIARKAGTPPDRLLAEAKSGQGAGDDESDAQGQAQGAAARMAHITDAVVDQVAELARIAGDVDDKFAKTGRKIVDKTRRDLDKFRAKVRDAERGDDGSPARDRLTAALWPRGGPQERTYNALPYVAQHGGELIQQIVEAIDPNESSHQLLMIQGNDS